MTARGLVRAKESKVSLDVSLITGDGTEVYSANITHNLNKMAREAGIYECLWRPDECGIAKAAQIIEPLRAGLAVMCERPTHFEGFDSSNGWGKYVHFLPFCARYLEACIANPDADVSVSR
jgi:hypothetical protein